MNEVPVCHKCGRVRCVCPARRARGALVALATTALLLALAACGYDQGPAGTVVDKDSDYVHTTKSTKYELTVRTADGKEHEFRVSSSDYDDCRRGSAYPRCTDR